MSQSQRRSAKRVTIKDVAEVAGVSVTTVSNVLNDRTEAMAEATLRRIQATIRDLDYHPSSVARSLVTSHTATIGVIVAEIDTPLFLQALKIIEPGARRADYNILLCTTNHNLVEEPKTVNLLLEKQVDGIIFLSTSVYLTADYLAHLPSSAPPMVLINRATEYDPRFDRINMDNTGGVVKAVEHLVRLGHRRIALLTGPVNRRSSDERLRGYRAGLEQYKLAYCEDYIGLADYEMPQETWEQATLELLERTPRPTAILAADDIVAATVMRTVQRTGLHIPNDISVVGFDNQPFCTYLNPALTTVQLPILDSGQLAIDMLLARISGQRPTTEQVILPCPLIERESTGAV